MNLLRTRDEPNFVTERLIPEPVNAHFVAYRVNTMARTIERLLLRTANLEKQVATLKRVVVAHKVVIMKLRSKRERP